MCALLCTATASIMAQDNSINNIQLPEVLRNRDRKEIAIPNIPGYQTLKCDFHIHTIFSDGSVWPTVRVEEAWTEGLDAISITEHLEYSPKEKYVSTDKNASYEIAKPMADQCGILLIHGGEITRSMPPGHLNALFIDDANKMNQPDPMNAIREAKAQDAFILWNHPGWKAQQPDTCLWMPMHEEIFEGGMMHGIEVFNEKEWYPIALDWCLDKGLAPIANSDIHGVAEYFYDYSHALRPMTLVFAANRSESALKEALMDARTVALFNNQLAGKSTYLSQLFDASIEVVATGIAGKEGVMRYLLVNHSDIPYVLSGGVNVRVPAKSTVAIFHKPGSVEVDVQNMWVGSQKNLKTTLQLK